MTSRLSRVRKTLLLLGFCFGAWGDHACAATESTLTITSARSSLELPATLFKPDGEGPFPAIVIMHDCSGLGPRSSGVPRRWSRELVEQGYVVLIPDSFTPRGFTDGVCTIPGDSAAWADARKQVSEFFSRHLKP